MTPEQTKAAAQVMIDFANGKTVELLPKDQTVGPWTTILPTEFPHWNWSDFTYRVKVEPRKYYVAYLYGKLAISGDSLDMLLSHPGLKGSPAIEIVSFTEDSK